MPFTYILKSINNMKFYVGSTTDMERRLSEHNNGKSLYTRRFIPWKIVYIKEYQNLFEARKNEKYLKSAAGRRFIKSQNIPW